MSKASIRQRRLLRNNVDDVPPSLSGKGRQVMFSHLNKEDYFIHIDIKNKQENFNRYFKKGI